ncbi:potassium-transporting ATPase subunit KdpC [Corticibacter populi]|uniref:Potassium-transporting ATPase KdpC subunit n=1 Tax=Corticibacter populi TaxID=1550736 RepID=A0A3M6QYV9_9BURK|nr:potassium-transporting ATPase subunit KdpC [Corticibacter populi]RMX08207.1 potassium-transporting ATPase subunit KdpC [Corticibacter populi]RZS35475.1 K+-transporting ATPase ATPase C chain [Corticibacter populi]
MPIQNTNTISPASAPEPVLDRGVLRGAIALAVFALLGLGLLYPLAGVVLGQALFPATANGSLIERDGTAIGSSLVAQPFADARYFQPRPSAVDYDAMAVSGSNEARTNPEMRQRVETARAVVAQREGVEPAEVPGDLVTQSGGGIDPHISPQAAAIQTDRVARARGLAPEAVEALTAQHTQHRQLGLLGQPRVNVLELNLALDALHR